MIKRLAYAVRSWHEHQPRLGSFAPCQAWYPIWSSKQVAIVGKGLTYDSGGYNLKPSSGGMMELMKFDMGGAGATIGTARALADIRLENIEVHFIVAACK